MKINMKNAARGLTGTAAMLLLILILLISAFQVVLYSDADYKHFKKEYVKYDVTENLHMNMDDVMTVTSYMMAYLIGKEDTLSIEVPVNGETRDFFNDQDRFHMAEVKNLFLGGLRLRTVCIIVTLILLGILILSRCQIFRLLSRCYRAALGLIAAAAALITAVAMKDFTIVFTIFHQIFFDNDLWLFDTSTDLMINMLPEGFFSDMVLSIGLVFVVLLMLAGILLFFGICSEKKLLRPHS